ncbi:Alpha-(1,3)-fucosyltransferase 11 [Linnemannia schmuckeri]|uniref:Fucosyltransferase n=1 Tax=Linnemannia schmuckeri TaxID=64567 RepID=A0A9P5S2Z7_9FUNG|nr:Alpha-(1,3)-fucosyltransferase 11 [Linnemannia schmuckeri]
MTEIYNNALQERQHQPKKTSILWWFGKAREEGRVINNCGLPYSCKFTLDRNWYNDSKIIIAHAPSFQFDFPYLDDVKSGRKALLLNTLEAPQEFQINSKWTDIFTYMWSYSFGTADFIESYFAAGRGRGTFIESILAKPMYTIQEMNAFRKDLAPIAWIVSNCRARNGRHHYVEQLLKYIKVDIYGKCMMNKKWPVHPDGLKVYSRFLAPNRSSIRLDDFATSKQLAHHIHQLDQDDAAYMKYLDYKEPTASIESLLNPKLFETLGFPQGTWDPDGDEARCGIYKMARDMAEGTYHQENEFIKRENQYIKQEAELYWWLGVVVVLGIFTGMIIVTICCKSHRAKRFPQVLRNNLTPSGWRDDDG